MKQKTIATRHLRTKIAAGYVLILFVIFGIVYIWLNEQHRRQELEITSQKIRCLRKDIHEVYVKMVDLSLIGETVLDWNEEDMNIYHKKRLEVDSLLSLFKSSYRSERIDSVCRLLTEKENLLNKIMLVLNEQEEIKDKIARRVPVIARKSSQEEPPKRKRTGFLGLFGKKEEAKPTVTTSMLNTLNSDVIARRKIMLTVTHELRTPLTAINGYGELLAQTEDENKRIEYTQNIRQAARKNPAEPKDVVKNWMRLKNTLEYLGLWEQLNNPAFKGVEFDPLLAEAGSNAFTMSPISTRMPSSKISFRLQPHCSKIAAGYVLILFVIFGIVYIWLNEQNRQQELEATTYKIKSLRKDVHEVYMKAVDLSMIGETDGSYIKYFHFFGGYMEEISYLCYVNNNTESNGDKL